jgi:hypothetical protein
MKPTVAVPRSHRDLLTGSVWAALATVASDGSPRVGPVGCDFDGTHVLVHLTPGSAESRNLAVRPLATVLVIDPDDSTRWIEVRGEAEGAARHTDRPTNQPCETQAVCRIRPTRVNLDAIHR